MREKSAKPVGRSDCPQPQLSHTLKLKRQQATSALFLDFVRLSMACQGYLRLCHTLWHILHT